MDCVSVGLPTAWFPVSVFSTPEFKKEFWQIVKQIMDGSPFSHVDNVEVTHVSLVETCISFVGFGHCGNNPAISALIREVIKLCKHWYDLFVLLSVEPHVFSEVLRRDHQRRFFHIP